MDKDVRLIPFTVKAVYEEKMMIPEGVQMIGPQTEYWEKDFHGEGVVVAILDTGCQTDHPDLKNRIIDGVNFTTDYKKDKNKYEDNNGHGTHVAGTIAANGYVMGVAPGSKLLICKVLDGDGSGSYESIIQGIYFAINWKGPNGEKVRVISMSLGGSVGTDELHKAIQDAVDANISVVVASGNEGDENEDTFEYSYPGAYNEVIEIGAVDYDGKLAYFSNMNTEVDAVAPGVDIVSTYPSSRYAKFSGTSMATPHVAGALALVIQKAEKEFARTLTEAEVYAQLIKHTRPLGFKKSSEGNGLVKLDFRGKLEDLSVYINKHFCV
jgi:major intracellular serine protease